MTRASPGALLRLLHGVVLHGMRASLVNRVGPEFRNNGTSELKMPGFSFHMSGNSISFSAAVTGTLMGFPVSSYRALFGTTHGVTVEQTFFH